MTLREKILRIAKFSLLKKCEKVKTVQLSSPDKNSDDLESAETVYLPRTKLRRKSRDPFKNAFITSL
jgi:hypothetical protein